MLDETKAFSLMLTTPAETEGLPPTLLAATDQSESGTGPWKITLDAPVFIPFMEHSRRRDLREQLYRAFITRASSGERDNLPLLERILQLRQEKVRDPRLPFVCRGEPRVEDGARRGRGRASCSTSCASAALPRARAELDRADRVRARKIG